MNYPESELHKAVAKYLSLVLCKGTWWTSIAHGETADFKRGARMKARGAKAGVPDILIVDNGSCFWIELKAAGGTISSKQAQCHAELLTAGARVAICRSVDGVADILALWGIRTRDASVRKAAA
jgi:hypothetical protein